MQNNSLSGNYSQRPKSSEMLITISCSGFYPDFITVLCWAGHNNSDRLQSWKERATLGFLMSYLGLAIFFDFSVLLFWSLSFHFTLEELISAKEHPAAASGVALTIALLLMRGIYICVFVFITLPL